MIGVGGLVLWGGIRSAFWISGSRVKGEGYLLFGLLSRALLHCLTYLMAGFLDTALVIARRMPFVGVT